MVSFHEIFLGSRCNLNCRDCQIRGGGLVSVSKAEILAAMSSCAEPREGVSFFGGEPLLRSDLFDLIESGRQLGFPRIRLRTNGTLLADGRFLSRLLGAGCHHFEIKLFAADSRIHDEMTGAPGSLEQAWAGVALLRRTLIPRRGEQQPFVGVLIPLRLDNVPRLPETILTLASLRPDRIVLSWEISHQPVSRGLPILRNAINLALLNRMWVLTENLPLCFMKGLEAHVAELYLPPRVPHQHVAACRKCVYEELCPGTPAPFLKTRWIQDIKPVSASPLVEAIRGLVRRNPPKEEDAEMPEDR
jgi:pyruvate-formate lyase-activating enzyme